MQLCDITATALNWRAPIKVNMKILLQFGLAWILLFQTISAERKTKLLFVQILFRHGDRAPIIQYPHDPNPISFWEYGLGKLTKLGMRQQYALGKYFRSMYANFTTSSPLEIDVLSSEYDRCLKSVATNLVSFYAPSVKWSFDPSLNWQPIAIHYTQKPKDKYLSLESDCPRANAELIRLSKSPAFIDGYEDMFKNLTFHSGIPIPNWTSAVYLYDAIQIEKKYNLTVPSWIESWWEELRNVTYPFLYQCLKSPLLIRLRAGPLLGKIVDRMNEKIGGNIPDLKFQIYSAHDVNIVVVLNALNLFNMIQPPYCSSLFFELHEMPTGEKTVRILYQNSSKPEERIDPPFVLILEGCSEFCSLDYFSSYVNAFIPQDWDEECQQDKTIGT